METDNYFDDSRVDTFDGTSAVIDMLPSLELKLDDKTITKNLNGRVNDSIDYWNDKKGYDLKNSRNENVKMHLGNHIDKSKLYKYQIPFVENEIFVGVESIVSYVCAQAPQSEVTPANDSTASLIMAQDLEKYHQAHSQKFGLPRIFEGATRNMLLKRIGLVGLRFDPSYGKHGEIIPEIIDPDHVVIDKNAKLGENPQFIRITRKASAEELCNRFPKKRNDIYKELCIIRGTTGQLSQIIAYHEVWFTDHSKGDAMECVAWYFNSLVLEKAKDPNWFYDNEELNFLDAPMKPFIPFNYINDGSHWIDQTTPVEQAAPIQHLLNKRGRQIMENADRANPKEIYAGGAITKDDAENITGDPDQKIILSDSVTDIRAVVMQVGGQMLPSYVIQDKQDLRQTIHAILGTPPQFTGTDQAKQQTLGQDMMQKNQAQGRQDQIVRAVEAGANKYYNLLTQLIKVYYDEKHDVAVNGGDGQYDFIAMHSDKVDSGFGVMVREGSSLPFDKDREQKVALTLAEQDKIAPYDLYSMLDMPNPQKLYDNWVKYKTDPASLSSEVDKDLANRAAYIEFVEVMAGKKVEPPDDVTPDHLMAHTKQMIGDEFTKADMKYQKAFIELVKKENESLKRRTELNEFMSESIQQDFAASQPQGQPPTPAIPMQPGMQPQGMPGGMPGMGQPMPPPMPPQMGAPVPPPPNIGQVMAPMPPQMGM
jgi:hypothetical protein